MIPESPAQQHVAEWMNENDIPNPIGMSVYLLDFLEDAHGIFLCHEGQAVIDGEVIDITSDGVGYGEFDRVVP